jgi:hypothetical protein
VPKRSESLPTRAEQQLPCNNGCYGPADSVRERRPVGGCPSRTMTEAAAWRAGNGVLLWDRTGRRRCWWPVTELDLAPQDVESHRSSAADSSSGDTRNQEYLRLGFDANWTVATEIDALVNRQGAAGRPIELLMLQAAAPGVSRIQRI